MGRTRDSLDHEFPPRSGGRSPQREELHVGMKRGGPRVEMIVVVVDDVVLVAAVN